MSKQKIVIVGAGPVGALAALYAAGRGHEVEVYELRGGMLKRPFIIRIIAASICFVPSQRLEKPKFTKHISTAMKSNIRHVYRSPGSIHCSS